MAAINDGNSISSSQMAAERPQENVFGFSLAQREFFSQEMSRQAGFNVMFEPAAGANDKLVSEKKIPGLELQNVTKEDTNFSMAAMASLRNNKQRQATAAKADARFDAMVEAA